MSIFESVAANCRESWKQDNLCWRSVWSKTVRKKSVPGVKIMHRHWGRGENFAGPLLSPFFIEIFVSHFSLWIYTYKHEYKKISDLHHGIGNSTWTKRNWNYNVWNFSTKLPNMLRLRGIFDLEEFDFHHIRNCPLFHSYIAKNSNYSFIFQNFKITSTYYSHRQYVHPEKTNIAYYPELSIFV